MAVKLLQPNATVFNSMTINGGVTAHSVLSDSNDNTSVRTQDINKVSIVRVEDFDAASLGAISIDYVQAVMFGFLFNTRTEDVDVNVKILNSSATVLYTEVWNLTMNGYSSVKFTGAQRTTSDGSNAWTVDDVDGLMIRLDTYAEDPPNISWANFTKTYIAVTYQEGYQNDVKGVDGGWNDHSTSGDNRIDKVNGITTGNIAKINGV